jgi:Brp/Blh family beta-carotene 15,15'-monooxygenase
MAALAGSAIFGPGSTELHLTLLVVLLPFVGIPHGALDYALAKQFLQPRIGKGWAFYFLATYMLTMAIVLLLWWIHPTASFVAFLALTLYHFGSGDSMATPSTPLLVRIAEVLARGGLVLTLPAVFNREEILQLFSYLIPEPGARNVVSMLVEIMPVFAACLLVCIIWSGFQFIRRKEPFFLLQTIELAVLAALFYILPALLAFGVYFSFLHSIRHMLRMSGNTLTGSALSAVTGIIRLALPVTTATLVMGVSAYLLLSGVSFDMPDLVRVIFIGIASMTYPHALVVSLAEHAGAIPIQREVPAKIKMEF